MSICSLSIWISCRNQSEYDKLILGKWKGTEKETATGSKYAPDGSPFNNIYVFQFKKQGIMLDYSLSPHLDSCLYSIKKDNLTLGQLSFIIEKLDSTNMILREFNSRSGDTILCFRYYFIKIE